MARVQTITIGLIAGEASGDMLAADLIKALRHQLPAEQFNLSITGVLGPKLMALADLPGVTLQALYATDALAVMGFIEPLKQLPRLYRMRKALIIYFMQHKPDIFIGVDAPDFNLGVERRLRQAGIKTVHYVSPSVWAWRKGRIKTIRRAVDLILVLFPFEQAFYQNQGVDAVYVGHPLADRIPLQVDQAVVRQQLGLTITQQMQLDNTGTRQDAPVLALVPGSRRSEIVHLAPVFIETARKLQDKFKQLTVLVPFASAAIQEQFMLIKQQFDPDNQLKIIAVQQQAQQVMHASDVVLITSGTATLEAMLCHRPMVVAFKTSRFNAFLARLFVKLNYFALPNILFNQLIVPEFFQEQASVADLSKAIEQLLLDQVRYESTQRKFKAMHQMLQQQASRQAAQSIVKLLSTSDDSQDKM